MRKEEGWEGKRGKGKGERGSGGKGGARQQPSSRGGILRRNWLSCIGKHNEQSAKIIIFIEQQCKKM